MRKETRALFNELNNLMDEWDGKAKKPQAVRMYEEMIENFNERAGRNFKNNDRFNTRAKWTDEQLDELEDLAQSMADNTYTFNETFSDVYEKYKDRYGWSDVSEAIDFLDVMNNYRADALIQELISSEEAREIYTEGYSAGLDDEDINNLIYANYSQSGATGDRLYNKIIEDIKRYDAEMGQWN